LAINPTFETTDGSSPEVTPLAAEHGKRLPLSAFGILQGGDAFEMANGTPPPEGQARARAYVKGKIAFLAHGAGPELLQKVEADLVRQLSGNLQLIARLEAGRPLSIDFIPPGVALSRYGYPRSVSPNAAGLFWDHPDWKQARIALKQDKLGPEPHLVFHEMAHAIQGLAFTKTESELIYRTMLRTYGNRASVDEVFALYSEREFVSQVTAHDLRAPGVYGMARARWDENHVFTRFVRNLYFPYKPLAGPKVGGGGPSLFG